ncbi:MAG: ParB/RepB/Spo0J family partition protein [Rubrobacteraceae bacterium]
MIAPNKSYHEGKTETLVNSIAITEIDANLEQPRQHFERIEELADSIRADGLLEPVMVRPRQGRYQLIHGERRYRAAKLAGLSELPAILRDVDDETMFRLSLIENVQRSNLTPIEEARSYKRLVDDGHTQAEIGRIIGKGQSYVSHKLRLLKAPAPLVYPLEVGKLTENHFRQVMRFKNVIGENLPGDHAPKPPEPKDDLESAAFFMVMRPCEHVFGVQPCEFLTASVQGWAQYVLKHDPPLWERIAWWFGTWIAGLGANVAETTKFADWFEDLLLSGVVTYHNNMTGRVYEDESGVEHRIDAPPMETWDAWKWATFADMKHSCLLEPLRDHADSEPVLRLTARALEKVLENNYIAAPSQYQGERSAA